MAHILQNLDERHFRITSMLNVIEMPVDRLPDQELALRKWEAVMSGGYGSAEYRLLERETVRRMSGRDDLRGAWTQH